jgi:hypothetical protein
MSGDDYIDLANTYMFVEAHIVVYDDTALDAGADVGPVNLRIHSLFSDVSVSLNACIRMSWGVQVPFLSENIIRCGPLLSLPTSGLFSLGMSFHSSLSWGRERISGVCGEKISKRTWT